MKAKVKYIPCLFEDRKIEFESHNETVLAIFVSLFQRHPEVRDDPPCLTVRVNGKKLHPLLWGNPLKDGDEVLIIQETGYDVIVYTLFALGVIGWNVAQAAFTAYPFVMAAVFIASVAYTIYSYCTAPSAPKTGQGLNSSPTYGWEGAAMTVRQGIPVPIVYGENLLGGNIIGGK